MRGMTDPPGTAERGDELAGRPAVVVPRAGRVGSDASLPVEQLLRAVAEGCDRGLVLLTGGPGSGKTVALRHLRAVLPKDLGVGLFDVHQAIDAQYAAFTRLVVLAAREPVGTHTAIDVFALRPWGIDDCLEYLVAVHRGACAAVLKRLADDASLELLGGSPQLLVPVMDAMANEPAADTARDCLRRHAAAALPTGERLDQLIMNGPEYARLNDEQRQLWRHAGVQRVCTADWIAARLAAGEVVPQLADPQHFGELLPEIAAAVAMRPAAVVALARLVADKPRSAAVPMAASVLLSVDPTWRPAVGVDLNLAGAKLAGAQWAGLDLNRTTLIGADLTGADLSGADLTDVDGDFIDLTGARLHGVRLTRAKLVSATLRAAEISDAIATKTDFREACMAGVDLRGADCTGATFGDVDLTDAQATGADFSMATFERVEWAGADFSAARFGEATLRDVDLTGAEWGAAGFAGASLIGCNLEGLALPDADFTGADLSGSLFTGSQMRGGRFRDAILRQAGLADIDWTDADLRGADLEGASFHLGSTRSGLVGSAVPMEGSMTGFYTDDYNDQSYRPPEEIRKACLCGANLLGARVEQTDFYLVDLRRARYSRAQGEHFARTGAILR
jgi:uncharacterized protein YjbI with pentapeptide repeats